MKSQAHIALRSRNKLYSLLLRRRLRPSVTKRCANRADRIQACTMAYDNDRTRRRICTLCSRRRGRLRTNTATRIALHRRRLASSSVDASRRVDDERFTCQHNQWSDLGRRDQQTF